MKYLPLLASVFVLPALMSSAQAAKVDVKQAMIDRCAAEVEYAKVADKKTALKLCTCTNNVQANYLKLGEYWEIQSAAMNGINPNNLPALKKIKPKLDSCRKGLTLNPPQLPAPAKK